MANGEKRLKLSNEGNKYQEIPHQFDLAQYIRVLEQNSQNKAS